MYFRGACQIDYSEAIKTYVDLGIVLTSCPFGKKTFKNNYAGEVNADTAGGFPTKCSLLYPRRVFCQKVEIGALTLD